MPLTLSVEILHQLAPDTPPTIEGVLSNDGAQEITVGMGPTLMLSDNFGSDLEWPEEIILKPKTDVGPWPTPFRGENNCWRFPKEGRRPIRSSLEWREIMPDDSINETYEVYTKEDVEPCLPKGTYQFQDVNYFESEYQQILLTLQLNINENNQLSGGNGSVKFHD